jgi:hypothetical protein
MRPSNDERGIALVLAMFALVVIGALVGSTFVAGRVEQQSGRNTFYANQAREAAEAGLSDALAVLEPATLTALVVGHAPLSLDSIALGNWVSANREVTRLTSRLFLIRSRGVRRTAGGIVLGARSLGALVEVASATAPADTGSAAAAGVRLIERGWIQLY